MSPIKLNIERVRGILVEFSQGPITPDFAEAIDAEEIVALAQSHIDLTQAHLCDEATIRALEDDNRAACARIAELEAMVGRVERVAGL